MLIIQIVLYLVIKQDAIMAILAFILDFLVEYKIAILAFYLLIINIITFIVYAVDKHKAENDSKSRIPEKVLLLLAFLGGSLGAVTAMLWYGHKTGFHKDYFRVGMVLIIIMQIVVLLYVLFVVNDVV